MLFFCEQAAEQRRRYTHLPLGYFVAATQGATAGFCDRLREQRRALFPDHASGRGLGLRSGPQLAEHVECRESPAGRGKLAHLNYDWQWQEDGSLSVTTPVLPAVRQLNDGRTVFFNQLIAAFRGWKDARNSGEKSICFGDGSAIGSSHMALAIELADKLTFDIPWQSGDVALLDNFLVMHGRRPFQGKRTVLASLVA